MSNPSSIGRVQFTFIVAILLLTMACGLVAKVNAASEEDTLRTALQDTYLRIASAEQRGADISSAATKLNAALYLIEAAGNASAPDRNELLTRARALIEEVNSSIPSLISQGETTVFWSRVTLIYTVIFIGVVLVLIYVFVPIFFWRIWLKLKKDWRIQRND